MPLDAVCRASPQLIERPPGLGDTDDQNVEVAALGQRL